MIWFKSSLKKNSLIIGVEGNPKAAKEICMYNLFIPSPEIPTLFAVVCSEQNTSQLGLT